MACGSTDLNVDNFIAFAEELLTKCKSFQHIEGSSKLERKILSEIKFLKTLKKRGKPNANSHLKSSNLSHYSGVVHAAEFLPGVIQVLQPFSCPGKSDSLIVDVVAGEGHMWVKVIARKAQALHLVWAGNGQFGERDLLQQVDEYLECIQVHPFNFLTPEIHFAFYNNVTAPMAKTLEEQDIKVWGHRVPVGDHIELKLQSVLNMDDSDSDVSDTETCDSKLTYATVESSSDVNVSCDIPSSSETISQVSLNQQTLNACGSRYSENYFRVMNELLGILPDFSKCDFSYEQILEYLNSIKKVNLDITTLIALVSGVTHGGSKYVFKEKILTQQATEERNEPCLPIIKKFLEGKDLVACKSAIEDFNTILNTLGGEREKERANELLQRLTLVDDEPSERALQLEMYGKVKGRSRIIFGTGDTLRAITITANSGFVRAARNQGISFAVYIHPARALTEMKEKTAVSIATEEEVTS